MRRTRVPPNVTRSTKLGGAQRSAELASGAPENLIFPASSARDQIKCKLGTR